MVRYEVRALVGALIGLIGFFGFTAVALAVHGGGPTVVGAVLLGCLWLVFWLVYFHIKDGRRARSTKILGDLLMICGAAMAVHAEFAKLLDDRSIARTAADQWSIVVGAVMLAVLATLAIRTIARTGNSPRWSG